MTELEYMQKLHRKTELNLSRAKQNKNSGEQIPNLERKLALQESIIKTLNSGQNHYEIIEETLVNELCSKDKVIDTISTTCYKIRPKDFEKYRNIVDRVIFLTVYFLH